MAPERFSGGSVGPPADVYSLACVLFECLTGQPPYPTGDLPSLMSAHLLSPPPRPSVTHPGLHQSFDAVILWGMAKDPATRCPSAGELARAASAAAATVNPPPRSAETGSARYGLGRGAVIGISVAVVVLAAAAVGGSWLAFGGDRTTAATPTSGTMTRVPTTSSQPETTGTTATTTAPSTTLPPPISLPGTDELGFVDHPGARCAPGQRPVALGLTAASAVVVCQYGPDAYYYRGDRLKDGAVIELDHAVPSAGGFNVVNPSDGTRYEVGSAALTIVTPDGEEFSEPMIQYAAS
jgi:serine/threonine-protein kinase